MTEHIHAAPAPVGGRLLTPLTFTCGVLILAALAILAVRFVLGLGAVTRRALRRR